ncbi:uncharacterized protein LOC141653256 [Silene latifolia]|uniref:uncharacterized protein LOC141653256 n=1 Tax=Silene latifolia TaxID=37657 RepID=UPI003D77DAE7
MAFLSRAGSILKKSVSKQIGVVSQISASNPSIYQALRCMSSSKLFVGGLSYSVDENGLHDAFSRYGQVIEAKVIIDREQNRSKGFGFVTFASVEEASSALQALDGQDLQGRRVRVNYATERAPRSFGGGGGGFGGGQQSYGGGGGYGGGQQSYGGGGGYGGGQYGGGNSGGYGGGQYGGGNSGGYGGGNSGGYGGGNTSGYGGGYPSANAAQGVAAGAGDSFFGGGAAGGNVTADTGFGSSGFEDGAGLGNGGSDLFGDGSTGGDLEPTGPSEGNFGDDEPDNVVKQA